MSKVRRWDGEETFAGTRGNDGVVYWGSGYKHLPVPGFVGNNKFYAFSLGGK